MNELTNLANQLNISVNAARKIISKYDYKSKDLTPDIVSYIIRTEKGETQQVFQGETPATKSASDALTDGVSYLELVDNEGQAQTLFSLAQTFGLDPNNIPKDEVESLKEMLSEAVTVAQAQSFLEESEKALIASQFTDYKSQIETEIYSSELAAELRFKAGKMAYNNRLLQLKESDRDYQQQQQEQLQSGLIKMLKAPELDTNEYQQKAMEGHQRFFGKMNRRALMVQSKL